MASLFFLHQYPHSRVLTVEPNPHLAELLRQNLEPWAHRTRIIEAALSVDAGRVGFNITRDNLLNVTGGIENREDSARSVLYFEVPSVSASEVLKEPVDLMKLDVEGHEYQLLPLEVFRPDHVRNLIVEFHDIDSRLEQFSAVLELLTTQRGYRLADTAGIALSRLDVRGVTGSVVLKLY